MTMVGFDDGQVRDANATALALATAHAPSTPSRSDRELIPLAPRVRLATRENAMIATPPKA